MRTLILLFLVPIGSSVLAQPTWRHVGTETGELPVPNSGKEQTAILVADLDKDGINDFVITERTSAPAVVWYRKSDKGWSRFIIDADPLYIEAGSTYLDIDGDDDLDIVFGGDGATNEVWWWENPYPDYAADRSWKRHTIKHSGAKKHHDQLFGDFDNDGRPELVFWNQRAHQLMIAEIPDNPREASEWELSPVFTWPEKEQSKQRGSYPAWKEINESEGLAKIDMDGDGIEDIVGGGRWFKYRGDKSFQENKIDASYSFTRCAVGQFIPGGRPEVVLVAGDGTAPLIFYQWKNEAWMPTILLDKVTDGHSIGVIDFNNDGHLDIFNAEMGLGNTDNPKARIFLGDGAGNFKVVEIMSGFGLHESLLVDLDGDGDLDLLGKPYTWKAPRIDIWLNEGEK